MNCCYGFFNGRRAWPIVCRASISECNSARTPTSKSKSASLREAGSKGSRRVKAEGHSGDARLGTAVRRQRSRGLKARGSIAESLPPASSGARATSAGKRKAADISTASPIEGETEMPVDDAERFVQRGANERCVGTVKEFKTRRLADASVADWAFGDLDVEEQVEEQIIKPTFAAETPEETDRSFRAQKKSEELLTSEQMRTNIGEDGKLPVIYEEEPGGIHMSTPLEPVKEVRFFGT